MKIDETKKLKNFLEGESIECCTGKKELKEGHYKEKPNVRY